MDSSCIARTCCAFAMPPGLAGPLLPVALRGLYRLAPWELPPAADRDSVRSAFTDQPNIEGWIVRLRCTWRVRRILEEYHFGCGPFFPFRAGQRPLG